MIALFTDFGLTDAYVGQMHAVLQRLAPGVPVIDLFHSVAPYHVRAGAYLLPAYGRDFPAGTVFVGVVDPGVGGPRRAVLLEADRRWYVGPDNGLFEIVARRAQAHACREIVWRPERLSNSFHGRDLFAPVAARLARGELPESAPTELTPPSGSPWPDDLPEVVHVDRYGNVVTGLRAEFVEKKRKIQVGAEVINYARVFSDVPPAALFWYENANGLVELAVHGGSAAARLGCRPGEPITVSKT